MSSSSESAPQVQLPLPALTACGPGPDLAQRAQGLSQIMEEAGVMAQGDWEPAHVLDLPAPPAPAPWASDWPVLPALSQALRQGQLSPLELVQASLDRIQEDNPFINAFSLVWAEEALEQAARAEKEIQAGNWRGPLHGVPFAVKELFDTPGAPTTAGSLVWKERYPQEEATSVSRLKAAGAILLGRLHMHEFAFGITSRNPHYGPTRNPWDPARMCGGSSSGSGAAVAAGMVPLALGTDTGGSIRIPSSLCGVAGLKTTYGRVSRKGVVPLAWSLDTVGPMAMDPALLAAALGAMAGPDPGDPACCPAPAPDYLAGLAGGEGLQGLRVGKLEGFFAANLRPDVAALVDGLCGRLEQLGARVEGLELEGVEQADRAAMTVLFCEAAACLEDHLRWRPEQIGQEVLANLRLGATIPATRYVQGLRVRRKLINYLGEVFSRVDLLVAPATTVDAPLMEAATVPVGPGVELDIRAALTRFTRYFNLAALPVLTLPCGLTGQGLPVGAQLVAAHWGEGLLLKVGRHLQQGRPWPTSPA